MHKFSIVLIDDEEGQLLSLRSFLEFRNYTVFTAKNGEEGYTIVQKEHVDLVITDFRMPGWTGKDVVERIKALSPVIEVVVMTAYGSVGDAVGLMKAGAYDYISKPINLEELELLIQRVEEKKFLVNENSQLREKLHESKISGNIISQSRLMEDVLNLAARVAKSTSATLILGESGTGKELIARAIHEASLRNQKPFVAVNIASLSENILESELFGHEKGAFTGASEKRPGRFEQANGGTLFLDEIGELPLTAQVKLLRVLQFGILERVGGNESISVDVRIVAATHRNLEEMIIDGSFREDFYYRINVITIEIPPLRDRKEDIPLLIEYFLKRCATQRGIAPKVVSHEALALLMKYSFPGNVRELENVLERAMVLSRGTTIQSSDLPVSVVKFGQNKQPVESNDYETAMGEFERQLLTGALDRSGGNQSAAARELGINERHLRSRLQRLGMK